MPLHDPERALAAAEEAADLGASAVWVASDAPGDISPTHVDFEPLWPYLEDAGIALMLHIGGGRLLYKAYHNTGRPLPSDWLGGGENLRAKDSPIVHHSPERFLTCMGRRLADRKQRARAVLVLDGLPASGGGCHPLERFEASLDSRGIGAAARRRFYETNFTELMGLSND